MKISSYPHEHVGALYKMQGHSAYRYLAVLLEQDDNTPMSALRLFIFGLDAIHWDYAVNWERIDA